MRAEELLRPPIPADTPGAEVIGRAMAVLWGAE